jgi:hypothetical protein
VIEPFTESEIEEAIDLFNKTLDECTKEEALRRAELLAQLQLDANRKMLLNRLTEMATPRDIP